jgi:asparagine synthase (glutamine-hydrolysing)
VHHYIAIVWSPFDEQAIREASRVRGLLLGPNAPTWRTALIADGVAVYSKTPVDAAMRTYVLEGDLGVIVGRLFTVDPLARPMRATDLAPAKIVETRGAWLLENCWGQYVAVLRTQMGDRCHILRDCSGHIPCHCLRMNGVSVFFADIHDLECLHPRLTLDTNYLCAFIARQPLHTRRTGLSEITELLAGDCVTLAGGEPVHTSLWNPRGLVSEHPIDEYPRARTAMLGMTESVVTAWAPLYRRILLSLSGGLDSAILLGCLKRLGMADMVRCVTQYTAETSDDERIYARAAARMSGVALTEIPRISDGKVFANKLWSVPPTPKPDISLTNRILALENLNGLADELGCDTLWTGQGGDQIFLQAHHAYGAADFLIQDGRADAFPGLIYESALLSGCSVWSVLTQALSYRFRKHRTPPVVTSGCGRRFLSESAPPEYPPDLLTGPWRADGERIPPGKVNQLDTVVDLLNRHTPLVGLEHPYEQHPLISQPLLELSLRISTYHLLRGGRQRAMARDAFADRVPSCILTREDKGGIADQLRSLLRGSAPLIEERLLDGGLASAGIIDRVALEGILRQQETFSQDDLLPIFACITAEAWMQHWTSASASALETSA